MKDATPPGYTERRTHGTDVVEAGVDRSVEPERTAAGNQGRALIGAGLVGTVLAAICCFTPLLVVVLPAVGLGTWLTGIDWALLPLLFVSVGVLALGLMRLRARTDACCETQVTKTRS